jgi:hypothetical protein
MDNASHIVADENVGDQDRHRSPMQGSPQHNHPNICRRIG